MDFSVPSAGVFVEFIVHDVACSCQDICIILSSPPSSVALVRYRSIMLPLQACHWHMDGIRNLSFSVFPPSTTTLFHIQRYELQQALACPIAPRSLTSCQTDQAEEAFLKRWRKATVLATRNTTSYYVVAKTLLQIFI